MYRHRARGLKACVHGDDISVTGRRAEVERFKDEVKARYEIKVQMMGQAKDLAKEVKILNRTITWGKQGISIEADPRHAREVVEFLDLWGAQPVATPGTVTARQRDQPAGAKIDEAPLEP